MPNCSRRCRPTQLSKRCCGYDNTLAVCSPESGRRRCCALKRRSGQRNHLAGSDRGGWYVFARSFNRDGEPGISSRPEAPPADPAIVETGDYIVLDVPNRIDIDVNPGDRRRRVDRVHRPRRDRTCDQGFSVRCARARTVRPLPRAQRGGPLAATAWRGLCRRPANPLRVKTNVPYSSFLDYPDIGSGALDTGWLEWKLRWARRVALGHLRRSWR